MIVDQEKITTKEECNNYFNNNENILTLFTTELTCYGKNAIEIPKSGRSTMSFSRYAPNSAIK